MQEKIAETRRQRFLTFSIKSRCNNNSLIERCSLDS